MGLHDHENTDDHRHLLAWALHSLANRRDATLHLHHHRWRGALFRPEISHRIQRSRHQMGKPHCHRTHDYPPGLSGRWEPLRIRLRDYPAERELYTSRVGSRSLPLSLPNPPHHARNRYRERLLRAFAALASGSIYFSSLREYLPVV
jgi:hypothetical protein